MLKESSGYLTGGQKPLSGPGADAINISGLLVQEFRLLNPKKLGNLKNQML